MSGRSPVGQRHIAHAEKVHALASFQTGAQARITFVQLAPNAMGPTQHMRGTHCVMSMRRLCQTRKPERDGMSLDAGVNHYCG
jgi:hypothetical protein